MEEQPINGIDTMSYQVQLFFYKLKISFVVSENPPSSSTLGILFTR